jgi:hypothetical protein
MRLLPDWRKNMARVKMTKKWYTQHFNEFVKMWRDRATRTDVGKLHCPACDVDEGGLRHSVGGTTVCPCCPIDWSYLSEEDYCYEICSSPGSRRIRWLAARSIKRFEEAQKIAREIADNPRWYTYEEWMQRVKDINRRGGVNAKS